MPQVVRENCFLDMCLKGSATTKGFEGQIIVQSLSYSIAQAGEFDEDSAKNTRITEFAPAMIVKEVDQSTPALAKLVPRRNSFQKRSSRLWTARTRNTSRSRWRIARSVM